MKARGDRDGLLRMLRHSDVVNDTEGRAHDLAAERRLAAAEALGELPRDSAVVAGLVDALDDPAERVRLAAVRSLKEVGDTSAVDPIARSVAESTSAPLRDEAASTLVALGGASACRAYGLALMRRGRADALGPGEEATFKKLRAADEQGNGTRRLVDDILSEASVLGTVPPVALHLLTWIGSDAVDALLKHLHDPSLAAGAAMGLGAIGDQRALEPLSDLLSSGNARSRHAAAWSLGELHDPRAVAPLLRGANDDNPSVRTEASQALDKLGTVGVIVGVAAVMQRLLPSAPESANPALAAIQASSEPSPTGGRRFVRDIMDRVVDGL
jgi:HEAT repeat protein